MRQTIFLLTLLLLAPAAMYAQATAQSPTPAQASPQTTAQQPTYTLPPAKLRQAIAYSRARIALTLTATLWSLLQLLLILTLGIAARMCNAAVNLTRSRWLQCLVFLAQLLLLTTLLDLPLSLYGHHLAVAYGQSVQHWPSWFADHGKSLLVTWAIATFLVMLLFWVIRKSPQRWWLWFSMVLIPIIVFGIYLAPIAFDPLFNHFEPLQNSNPALVAQLEQVVARTGVSIPPNRIFLMRASDKTPTINAYVTGIGPSKRFVLWDTAIAQLTPAQLVFVFGHETGHYVLHHIAQGIVFTTALLFVLFYLGYRATRRALARYGRAWRIPSQNDWAALVVLLLMLSCFDFLATPIENAFSRHIEHAADVYGQEAIHGLVPSPQVTAVTTFQRLGEASLEDPHPNPIVEFWLYNHPSVASRAAFAQSYNPWAPGQQPQYFAK